MQPHSNQGLDRLIKPTRLAVDLDGHVTLRPGPVRWHSAAGTRPSLRGLRTSGRLALVIEDTAMFARKGAFSSVGRAPRLSRLRQSH
jgi:hypothetical protein